MTAEAVGSGNEMIRMRDALRLPFPLNRYHKRFIAVASAIEAVHWINALDPIKVYVSNNHLDNGVYHKEGGTGKPVAIEISKRGDNFELTFAHEIGHFLEGNAIPGSQFGVRQWASDDNTIGWQRAVAESRSAKRLAEIRASGVITVTTADGSRETRLAFMKTVEYFMRPEEFWARSYAQYIAVRSGHQTLLKQVEARRFPTASYPLQWEDEDFESIADQFDILFGKIGWRQ